MKNINKKTFAIISIIILVIIVGIIILVNVIGNKPLSQEEKLEELFTTMSVEYYEDHYYNLVGTTQEERESFLKKFKSTGIQFSLDSLSRYNAEVNKKRIEEFVNLETNEKCDIYETTAVVYPKEPYEKDSYEIKVKLDCGFKKEK